jgi:hypothetical protein
MLRIIAAILAPALLLSPSAMADEVVRLVDKTKIVGKLLHYYEGVLTIKLPNGATMRLPRDKVAAISFALPKPRAAFSSPRKSFARLREAALKGDLERYIDAHSAYYQMFLNHQVAQLTPAKFRKQLRKQWGSVQLEIVGGKKKDGMATLKVRRKQGSSAEEGEFRFVKENGEWKMILPL